MFISMFLIIMFLGTMIAVSIAYWRGYGAGVRDAKKCSDPEIHSLISHEKIERDLDDVLKVEKWK